MSDDIQDLLDIHDECVSRVARPMSTLFCERCAGPRSYLARSPRYAFKGKEKLLQTRLKRYNSCR